MGTIKSISEAFSMQPILLKVKDPEYRKKYGKGPLDIQRIEKEQIEQDDWNYVGYNFDGQKLFEYHWRSVNVHYIPGI